MLCVFYYDEREIEEERERGELFLSLGEDVFEKYSGYFRERLV